jgi:uncharacterized membrane protein YiaA
VPGLILLAGVLVQGFSKLAIQQKMVAGDEEYHEPNRFLRALLETVIIAVALIAIGMYLASRV